MLPHQGGGDIPMLTIDPWGVTMVPFIGHKDLLKGNSLWNFPKRLPLGLLSKGTSLWDFPEHFFHPNTDSFPSQEGYTMKNRPKMANFGTNSQFSPTGWRVVQYFLYTTPTFLGIPILKSQKWGPNSSPVLRYSDFGHFPLFSKGNPFVTMKFLKKSRFSQNPRTVAKIYIWWTPPHLGSTELSKLIWGQNSPRGRRYTNVNNWPLDVNNWPLGCYHTKGAEIYQC